MICDVCGSFKTTDMNHLCGLPVNYKLSLSEDEAVALDTFRTAYNDCRPTSMPSSDNEKNESAPVVDTIETATLLAETDQLPECGWRVLDDITLYRFLCADRENKNFQQELSLDRLRRAMKFRKDNRVDELVGMMMRMAHDHDNQSSKSPTQSTPRLRRPLISIASGALSPCGTFVDQFQKTSMVTTSTKKTKRAAPLANLEKYQSLRVRVFTGRDYQNLPVMFERLGDFLGSGSHVHFSEDEWCRFYIWDLERHFIEMREASRSSGSAIFKYIFCGDCSGIISAILNGSVWKVVPLLKSLVRSVEDFYPEIAAQIILFNVPKAATVFYNLTKTFIDPVTVSKISLYSGVPTKEFLRHMPLDAIPADYGGTNLVPYPATAYC